MVLVENTRKGKLNLRFGVKLLPGVNEVDSETWKKCRVDPVTRHYLDRNELKVTSIEAKKPNPALAPKVIPPPVLDKGSEGENPSDTPPKDPPMNAKKKIAMIQEMENGDDLDALLDGENRSTVVAAINKRLDELTEEE